MWLGGLRWVGSAQEEGVRARVAGGEAGSDQVSDI